MRMQFTLGTLVAPIAVAKWLGERLACVVQPNVVHRPAVDRDAANSLRGKLRGLAQALLHAADDLLQRPVQAVLACDRAIRNAVHQRVPRRSIEPAQQAHAAALRAQVDSDGSPCIFRRTGPGRFVGLHRGHG